MQQEGSEHVGAPQVQEVVLAHHEGGLDDAVGEVETATVPPFGGHQLQVRLHLLHAHRQPLQFLHLALPQNSSDNIEVLPAYLEWVSGAELQVSLDAVDDDGLLADSQRTVLAHPVDLHQSLLDLVELVYPGTRVGDLHLALVHRQVNLALVLVGEAILPGQDSLRVYRPLPPEHESEDYLRLPSNHIKQAEILVPVPQLRFFLLGVGLNIEELRGH